MQPRIGLSDFFNNLYEKDRGDWDLLFNYLIKRLYLAILSIHDIKNLYKNSDCLMATDRNPLIIYIQIFNIVHKKNS